MKLRDGRKIWITFQVCNVNGPIMSVGRLCTKGNDRCSTFNTRGGTLWHEEDGEIVVDRVRNHYELECWIKPRKRVGASANWQLQWKRHRTCGTACDSPTTSRCRDSDGYTASRERHAPKADEEYIELEILLVASLPGPREPSKDEIEKHNSLHDPAMPQ